MSLINNKNNIGPSIDPCGTPDPTSDQVEQVPFNTTLCCLPIRQEQNHESKGSPIPYIFNLDTDLAGQTESNAFAESKYIMSVSTPQSRACPIS